MRRKVLHKPIDQKEVYLAGNFPFAAGTLEVVSNREERKRNL